VRDAERVWSGLDECWREAFGQAWQALRAGSIPIGACAATPDGAIVHAARNRVADSDGPAGEVFGSTVAHAEMNVLARLPFRARREFVLTSTLEPCIQCSAAIRLGPVASVRYAGADPLWQGCHDFSPLSPREAARAKATLDGPRDDEAGVFGALISRFGPGLRAYVSNGIPPEDGITRLARELDAAGDVPRLAAMEVDAAFAALFPRLPRLLSWNSLK
jgi:tRNA(adenine34) deaminase